MVLCSALLSLSGEILTPRPMGFYTARNTTARWLWQRTHSQCASIGFSGQDNYSTASVIGDLNLGGFSHVIKNAVCAMCQQQRR